MRRTIALTILIASAFLFTSSAFAADSGKKAQAMKQIEMLRIWRLTELLELSAADGAKIFPVLQEWDQKFSDMGERKQQLIRKMRRELKQDGPKEQSLKNLTNQVFTVEQQIIESRKEMYSQLKRILTPEQLAKYMLFELSFQKEIDEIINHARQDRKRSKKVEKVRGPGR